MNHKASIVWFQHDLRTEDHPALHAAIEKGGPIIPLYIWAPQEEGNWPPGGAKKWWLHHSLLSLQEELQKLKLNLVIRKERSSLNVLKEMIDATGADTVYWNQRYEPIAIQREALIKKELIQ